MKDYLRNWNVIRAIRLVFGIVIMVQAFHYSEWGLLLLGGVFTALPLFNIGCGSTQGCATNIRPNRNQTENITFEEVK